MKAPTELAPPVPAERLRVSALASALAIATGFALPSSRVIAASPRPAPGQHRVAFVNVGPAKPNELNIAAFRSGLADLGYVEGRNLVLDVRWGDQRVERLPGLVNELLGLHPKLVVSTGGAVTARVVKGATALLPIVAITGDPVAEGLVPNLARPGGNLTGLAVLAGELEAKRLDILAKIVPKARRIGLIWNPTQPSIDAILVGVEQAAKRLDLTLLRTAARSREELPAALADISRLHADALFVVADPVLGFERSRIVEFATSHRLPGVYFWREFAEIGGLASYGTNLTAIYRRAASYVDRILKGARPGDLPIEQPTTFELVLNLRAARALGITVPNELRRIADEIIE